jgi:hypothetical protein
VTLAGPAAAGTGEVLDPAPLPISIDSPDPERARELRLIMPAPPENDPIAEPTAPPPLLGKLATRVPIGHLSYSAVSLYESCGYRFYLERVLGAREGLAPGQAHNDSGDDIAELEIADEMPDPGPPRALALGIGNSVHAALEWSAGNRWQPPDRELIGRILAREGLGDDPEAARRVEDLVGGWLGSKLCAELGAAGSLRAEVPFALGVGATVIRGQIDLLARDDGLPCVVDYKTDALHGRPPAELAQRYRAQREIYALAVGGDEGARVAHVFLENPQAPVIEELGPVDLAAARERVEALIERMAGGAFEVTENPYPALCFGCPAAARLCPRPEWHPGR